MVRLALCQAPSWQHLPSTCLVGTVACVLWYEPAFDRDLWSMSCCDPRLRTAAKTKTLSEGRSQEARLTMYQPHFCWRQDVMNKVISTKTLPLSIHMYIYIERDIFVFLFFRFFVFSFMNGSQFAVHGLKTWQISRFCESVFWGFDRKIKTSKPYQT